MSDALRLVLAACAAILVIWLYSTGTLGPASDPGTSATADAGETFQLAGT